MRLLFVGGCQRSGTTAFADYLNEHEAVLVTRERYKFLAIDAVTPELFAFERILSQVERETNAPPEYHHNLLARKDPERLRWIGDKNPAYVQQLPTVLANNPGAAFIILYRPVDEVAESFEYKAKRPRDHWPERNDFAAAIRVWNTAQYRTREFIESHPEVPILVISYHSFFSDPERHVHPLSSFLGVEFGDDVLERWREHTARFHARRRPKADVTPEQEHLIAEHKDHDADAWVRDYIGGQYAG